jgi:ABC-2 type transport system permease protein
VSGRGPEARAAALAAEPLVVVGPAPGLVGGLRSAVTGIVSYRELLGLLVRRELKARYKDSALGFAWSLLRPLTMLVVYYVAIGRFLGAERAIPDFAVYVFTGLTAWFLFQEIVSAGTGSIVGNAGLIKKVYLPREVFPLAAAGSALVNFVTQLVILVAAVVVTGLLVVDGRLLWAPLSVAVLVVWGLGLALVLSAVNVYLRDVQYLVEISLMVMFWASPVVYSWEFVENALPGWAQEVYLANPVTAAVLGMQRAFWTTGETLPFPDAHLERLLVMLALGCVLVVAGQRLFARLQANVAQEL